MTKMFSRKGFQGVVTKTSLVIGAFVLSAFSSFIASAATEEGGHAEHVMGSFSDLIPFWINFLIYCLVLYLILRKKVVKGLHNRAILIEEQVNKGARELEKAEQVLREAEEKLSGVSTEVAAIMAHMSSDSKNECVQILREAGDHAVRIKEQAKELVISEQRATENTIKRDLTDLVLKKTTEKISRELTAENDKERRAAALGSVSALIDGAI